jgi:phenylacetic acid degradation operon negative regulatory protein
VGPSHVTVYTTSVSEIITREARRPSRGRTAGLVPFLFGLVGRPALPGAALRHLLEDLGVSPDAVRALLARMTRAGQLVTERHGRTVDYRLAGEMVQGFERIRDQDTAQPKPWTGGFAAVLYQVPEEHREFRDAFRRAAVLAGYGVLQPGVLISLTELGTRLDGVLAGRPAAARVWPARIEMAPDDAAAAASIAWDLPGLATVYRTHLTRLSAATAAATPGTIGALASAASPAAPGPATGAAGVRTAAGTTDAARTPPSPAAAGPGATGAPAASADGGGAAGSPRHGKLLREYVETLMPVLVDTLREPRLPAELRPGDWPGDELRQAIGRYSAAVVPALRGYLDELLPS